MRIEVYKTVLDPAYGYIDFFTYLLYIADVIINLRTTYIDSFGEEIKSTKKIFWHYIASIGFWIDVLSLFNYPESTSVILNMIGILKVNRVLRIYQLINQSNIEKTPKILLQILYYYLLFLIYLHLVACLWFYFVKQTYDEHLAEVAAFEADPTLPEPSIRPWQPPYDWYDGNDNFWLRYEN